MIFIAFFKDVNYNNDFKDDEILEINDAENEILDSPITDAEMKDAIKTLKNNEACGVDNIVNEHTKYSYPLLKGIYLKLF